MQVTKRDGTLEGFDLNKTRKVIDWACDGLSVNPLELESHIDIIFKDKVKTQDIQENLISHALSLVNLNNYDWLKVAANLRIMTRYKIYRDISFKDYVKKNNYSHTLLNNYTDEDLDLAFQYIDKERDKIYDYAGANALINKFLLPDEPLQYLYLASALMIALDEKIDRMNFVKNIYDAISLKKISLPTPTLANIRKGSSNLASCFIGEINDSLDSIFESLHKIAKISKNGGGIGVYIGNIRCNGSWIKGTKGAASGVVPWIKLINDTIVSVNQLGRRAGACTVAFPIWHYDLEEFLSLQTEHGDPRKKCFDIQPQLVCSDEFFRRLENNEKWYCFDPYEVKSKLKLDFNDTSNYQTIVDNKDSLEFVKEYDTSYLIKKLIETIVETGLPYITYIDTINRNNPNKNSGNILCTNLCTESFSNTEERLWHTCSLLSLNLANIEQFEIEKYSRLSVRMLDNILDICDYPISESEHHVKSYRTIGIGCMGLADFLAKNSHTYESAYSSHMLSNTFEKICYYTIDESINLAKERGPYPYFKDSEWYNGNQINKYKKHSNLFDWDNLQNKLNFHGIRNSQLLSPAPNTTSGLIQGCVAGILPPYNLLHYDDSTNGSVAVMPPYLSRYPLRYKAYKNYDMLNMIDYIAEMQKWIDTGISFESLMDLRIIKDDGKPLITAPYIKQFILKSWKSGIKANYYWRFITISNQQTEKNECISCSG